MSIQYNLRVRRLWSFPRMGAGSWDMALFSCQLYSWDVPPVTQSRLSSCSPFFWMLSHAAILPRIGRNALVGQAVGEGGEELVGGVVVHDNPLAHGRGLFPLSNHSIVLWEDWLRRPGKALLTARTGR